MLHFPSWRNDSQADTLVMAPLIYKGWQVMLLLLKRKMLDHFEDFFSIWLIIPSFMLF